MNKSREIWEYNIFPRNLDLLPIPLPHSVIRTPCFLLLHVSFRDLFLPFFVCSNMVLEDDPCAAPAAAAAAADMKASKKNKHKKVPQRGLGVAQLEKLRMEEQNKNADSSSADPQPQPQLHVPLSTTTGNEGFVRLPRANPAFAFGSDSASAQHLETSALNNDQQGFYHPIQWNGFDPNASSNESFAKRYGLHAPLVMTQRKPPPPPPPTTMVNAASLPLSSGVNLRIEPPSNQTNSNSYDLLTCWREQERNLVKVAGSKRPWPFHVDGELSQEPYPVKLHSFPSSCVKPEDFSSSLRQAFRGGTSTSNTFIDLTRSDLDLGNRSKESGGASDGKFLSLGYQSCLKSNDNSQLFQNENSDLSLSNVQRSSPNEKPFFNFIPTSPSGIETAANETREAAADDIDLSLKL